LSYLIQSTDFRALTTIPNYNGPERFFKSTSKIRRIVQMSRLLNGESGTHREAL
jgi:hypothetical protein